MTDTKKKPAKGKLAMRILVVVAVLLLLQWLFIGWRFNFGPFKALGRLRLSQMEGNAQIYDFSTIQPLSNSPLQGKTVFFLGSSVTNGAAALDQSVPEYFSARMGCQSIKEAVDGTTLCDSGKNSYIQRLRNRIEQGLKADLLICQLSTNDASQKKPLGEISAGTDPASFDLQTITGAMEYIISSAQQNWGCPVVFFTNARYENEAYEAMVDRLYELQKKWNIGILDLWSKEEFNAISEEERALYMKDQIHPTKAGYRVWWGPELEQQFCAFMEETERTPEGRA